MYILDTNVISELRKANTCKAHQNVIRWAKNVPSTSLYISVITVLELEMGILSKERKDPPQGAILRNWLNDHVLPAFSERILPIDTTVAQRCAKIHVPDHHADRDALIAATTIVYGMTLVTRNVADFVKTGADLLTPWEASCLN